MDLEYRIFTFNNYCVTPSSSLPKLVFNLTVTLKDSKPRDTATGSNIVSNASRSRKEEQAKQLADKMVRIIFIPDYAAVGGMVIVVVEVASAVKVVGLVVITSGGKY